jgi:hypothetical protein
MRYTFSCPHCGREGSTSQEVAPGMKLRCRGCAQVFPANMKAAQTPSRASDAELYPVVEEEPAVSTLTPPPLPDKPNPLPDLHPGAGFPEPEPWYYAHLWTHGELLRLRVRIITWVVFGFLCLLTVGGGLALMRMPQFEPRAFLGLFLFDTLIVLALLVYRYFALIRSAWIFLNIDQARNLRRLRIHVETSRSS